jgi:hypothetical protein
MMIFETKRVVYADLIRDLRRSALELRSADFTGLKHAELANEISKQKADLFDQAADALEVVCNHKCSTPQRTP